MFEEVKGISRMSLVSLKEQIIRNVYIPVMVEEFTYTFSKKRLAIPRCWYVHLEKTMLAAINNRIYKNTRYLK